MSQHRPHESNIPELNEFFGNPAGAHNGADPTWQAANLVPLTPPYPMKFSWGPPVAHLLFHRKVKDAFGEALLEIKKLYGTQADIEQHRMHLTGGSFMFRLMRGSATKLSIHSWGAALDIDPQHNPFPARWRPGFIPQEAAAVFQKCGLIWRGANGDDDPMHFQAVEHSYKA